MEDLYKHIEKLGKERGFKNMTVLCKAAGVPRSTMSELNNGRSKDISKPNAQKFADILGISLDEIYGESAKKAPTLAGEREISDEAIKFALFGGEGEITDAMYEEVKQFARMVRLREEAEKKKEQT